MPKRSREQGPGATRTVREQGPGATRTVTIKSGFQRGKERHQTRLATPGGMHLAWMNDPCSKCSGDEDCLTCRDQKRMASNKARKKGKKAAAATRAGAAAEEEEEQELEEEKGELELRAEKLGIGTPEERARLRSHDQEIKRRAQKLISQVRCCPRPACVACSSLCTDCDSHAPPSLPIQATIRAGKKLLEQIYEIEDTDPRSAFDSLVKYAEVCGNADALYRLGAAYAHPDEDVFDIKEDQEKAFHYYDMAIAKGHDGAMFQRGSTLVDAATGPCNRLEMWCWEGPLSEAQEKQVERGTHLLELAAEKGNACALSMLGRKYKGHDEEKSFHFFQRAVLADQAEFTVSEMQSFDMQSFRRGHANDLYELGKMYRYGRGTGVDEEKCLRFYEQAAALGHGEALDDLGEAYEYGHLGKEVNIETSIKYYEKSVEADPGPWADIIEKYGNVRTFVLGEERREWTDTEDEDEIDIEDKATGSKGKGSDQSSSYGKCAGEDEADKDEVNSEDEASGSKGNGSEQSSPCRKCAGEDKGEGEGDSGESGPLATSTLPWGDPAKAREMAQKFFEGMGPPGQPDQPSPSASGQPSSQDADPNAATMPNFDGYTDSAKVAAISYELREMGCDVPNENEIERELRKAKGNQQQAIDALTAHNRHPGG